MAVNEAIKLTGVEGNASDDQKILQLHEIKKEPIQLPELLVALMLENHKSVRKLAKEVGLSPTVIQNIRSAKKNDMRLGNFKKVMSAMGYSVILEKGDKRIPISEA